METPGEDLMRRTGGQVVRSSSAPLARHLSQSARFQQGSIPGYSGYMPGRTSEDVHGATFAEANALASEARAARARRGQRPKSGAGATVDLTVTIDGGCLNSTNGSLGGSVPQCKVASVFHNPRGHGPRAGAAVPGYAGFIPGKVAGSVFARRGAEANLQATQVRISEGATWSTNWIVASEADRQRTAPGATLAKGCSPMRSTTSRAPEAAAAGEWRLWQPKAAHEWLGY